MVAGSTRTEVWADPEACGPGGMPEGKQIRDRGQAESRSGRGRGGKGFGVRAPGKGEWGVFAGK